MSEPQRLQVKICGLTTAETMEAALQAGADIVALNFFAKSPRFATPEVARSLAGQARGRAILAGLLVDPDDAAIDAAMADASPDLLQLHGSETPERCAAIAARTGRPVMKAFGVARAEDLGGVADYVAGGFRLLLDAKPPKDAAYPGGHGRTFDWAILRGLDPATPFMLSGGLTPGNVGEAIGTIRGFGLALAGVDVSSGVESAPGVKDVAKIRAFVESARKARP